MSAESHPQPDRFQRAVRRAQWIALAGLVVACGSSVGIAPQRLVDRPPPEDWARENSSEEELISELLRRAGAQTCSVPAFVASRATLYGPRTELLISELDELSRLLCERGVNELSVQWGADGDPLILPVDGSAQFDDLLLLMGPTEDVYRHSGRLVRGGVACGGRVPREPDLSVFLGEAGATQVALESEDDFAFLWVRSPSGNDECTNLSESQNDDVSLMSERGLHRVWVGSQGDESPSWTLRVENVMNARGPTMLWTPGSGADLRVPVDVGAYSTPILSNGPQYCAGHIGEQPSFEIYIPATASGTITVESDTDSVLYLEGPSGAVLCNDDHIGLNAGVTGYFAEGLWRVYVGSFSSRTPFSATVNLH